jgi:lipopolysaccharide transport system ATP-binding protein
MSDTVIRVENLSKRYKIGVREKRAKTMRQAVKGIVSSPFKYLNSVLREPTPEEVFWALQNVSFEVKRGDVVGIIGRNGAGKSTLLKILSQITEPTSGYAEIRGRVGSLLEVGTGFHPDLTGRENTYLNGTIMGMRKREIDRRFDEIVDFAGVEKFIDTPVKHYSSGMYTRLAFAVAAHLEPEILIVDEVLAVGDLKFQTKCLGKMKEVGQSGRTILIVSHNMSSIQALCTRCVLLQAGNVVLDSDPTSTVQLYLQDASTSTSFVREKQRNGKPSLVSGKILSNSEFRNEKIQIVVEIFAEEIGKAAIDLRLSDSVGVPVGRGNLGSFRPSQIIELDTGLNHISFTFPINQLAVGTYFISLDLSFPWAEYYDRVENCLLLENIRPPSDGATSVLLQSWGSGSFEFPLEIVD